jgi:hypothetical protein
MCEEEKSPEESDFATSGVALLLIIARWTLMHSDAEVALKVQS